MLGLLERIAWWCLCHIDLSLVDFVLKLVFGQQIMPVCFWYRSPELGCLWPDIGNSGTVYVSGNLGCGFQEKRSNLDGPGASDLLRVGLIVAREKNSGYSLKLSLGFPFSVWNWDMVSLICSYVCTGSQGSISFCLLSVGIHIVCHKTQSIISFQNHYSTVKKNHSWLYFFS